MILRDDPVCYDVTLQGVRVRRELDTVIVSVLKDGEEFELDRVEAHDYGHNLMVTGLGILALSRGEVI